MEAKRYSSPFYRFFAEGALAMAIADAKGKIVVSNRKFGRMLASLDRPDFSVFTGSFSRILSGEEKEMVLETPVYREDGERAHWFKIHAWLMEKMEEAAGLSGPFVGLSIEDETNAREEEERLLAGREIAEKAMEAKSQFLANMSHEIRTPIQTVIGMTELLQDTALDREQSEYSRQIKFSAEVLLSLINDILDYSKIDAGRMELEHTDFLLEEAIEQAVEMISIEAHRKGLEIAMDIPPEVSVVMKGDPNKFRQIVINLAKNAVKFTKEGGVTISAKRASLKPRPEESAGPADIPAVAVSVADTGIGISEEVRSRLFTTFMQADASTTRRFGGTGLGLAISRNLVELMHGSIEMVPNEGGGSVFRFVVPLERSLSLPEPLPPVPADREYRILVADDRPEPRRIITSYLEDIGYTAVEAAASGEEALAVLRSAAAEGRPFDLCLVDSIMPVMDGWRLAAEIHNDGGINNAALVLMVPNGMLGADTKMTLLQWFKAYISKPVKRRVLAETVCMVLGEPVAELEAAEGEETGPSSLPSAAASITPAAEGVPRDGPAAGIKAARPLVLIVEDHPVNQKLFAMFMDKLGYPSIQADDGLDALEKAEANSPGLIFMDIQMPRMNGYEAAETLRKRGFRRPVIAVTASALSDERERCMTVGFDDILIKPFKRPDLEIMLNKWAGVRQDGEAWGVPARSAAKADLPPAAARAHAVPDAAVFDAADLLETFMGDMNAVRPLLIKFLERTGEQIAAIPGMAEKEDWESARREAHTIKGSSLTLSGKELGQAASRLELAFKNMDEPEMKAAYPPVAEAFTRFRAAALAFLEDE
ncbi:MAG: response regulator [Treponema sp.]|jgi:signal transduction histidine kinase/DNA-binding response OmpR family regulator/HPt (histidine-containing phosphotransfer) domain-containing protein|nr:response regulator [Treponema sp.]